ncbi:MAG: DUF1460 domain-containing protein [Thermoanaerobaculia bacterium]|nr:DUF1460 domain-containing protein [Thermoanaerobaculia bacterium]
MTSPQPEGLDVARVEEILAAAVGHQTLRDRMEFFSSQFIGLPYTLNPLRGSAETPEVFTASLDGFDCVTYVETVLALSLSSDPGEFVEWLRRIRYQNGQIAWEARNHYMMAWLRNNSRAGVVHPVAAEKLAVRKELLLDLIKGLPAVSTHIWCVPKRRFAEWEPKLATGDLIFFVSTRTHLDVFHCGILVRKDGRLLLHNAARSRKGVLAQDLEEFLKENRMSGVMVTRPVGVPRSPKP